MFESRDVEVMGRDDDTATVSVRFDDRWIDRDLTCSEVIALRDALTEWIGDQRVVFTNETEHDVTVRRAALVYGRAMVNGLEVTGAEVFDPRKSAPSDDAQSYLKGKK